MQCFAPLSGAGAVPDLAGNGGESYTDVPDDAEGLTSLGADDLVHEDEALPTPAAPSTDDDAELVSDGNAVLAALQN